MMQRSLMVGVHWGIDSKLRIIIIIIIIIIIDDDQPPSWLQVCSVLESLEREYRRDEDWCNTEKATSVENKVAYIEQQVKKHQEQKEAFLKACTLARRTAEIFIRYVHRCVHTLGMQVTRNPEIQVKATLEHLHRQENTVLEFWTDRKKKLDQCNQYVNFEYSAKQAIEWIHDTGELYLSTHTHAGRNAEETEKLLKEHDEFKLSAKETREKVCLLIQLADSLMEKGHAHASNIKSWVGAVDRRYKDFSARMEKCMARLEGLLGYTQDTSEVLTTTTTTMMMMMMMMMTKVFWLINT